MLLSEDEVKAIMRRALPRTKPSQAYLQFAADIEAAVLAKQPIRHAGPDLDDADLLHITRKRQPAAQARFLERMGVPYTRRGDGSLLVGRAAMEKAMGGDQPPAAEPVDAGIRWKVNP
ncbi:DUF4224 domain-containing protein [Variovorax sp. PBL-E5]|uniref:DUF4224 domain-containing protein n=1 Tax=Variovorax sp. PBL-E5 TaxID=434014 RepID=UPI0013182210|nr:DUF4224 domain-containing protein [Variovorax sp. PBL-E5]VTU37169.1 hypothetical protein E5CHR_04503 [Variovorax sp. PBL-E5]